MSATTMSFLSEVTRILTCLSAQERISLFGLDEHLNDPKKLSFDNLPLSQQDIKKLRVIDGVFKGLRMAANDLQVRLEKALAEDCSGLMLLPLKDADVVDDSEGLIGFLKQGYATITLKNPLYCLFVQSVLEAVSIAELRLEVEVVRSKDQVPQSQLHPMFLARPTIPAGLTRNPYHLALVARRF
jgi:hypothetical protein